MSAQLSRCVAVYSRHFVASHINAPVAVVFTLDHIVTIQTKMGWTKSLLYHHHHHHHQPDIYLLSHAVAVSRLQRGREMEGEG